MKTVIARIRILSQNLPVSLLFWLEIIFVQYLSCLFSMLHNIIETLGAVTFKSADAESSVSLSLHLIWTHPCCLQHSQTSASIQYKVPGIKPLISAQNYTAGWSVIGRFNGQIHQIISFHEINVSLRIFFNTTVFN